MYVKVLDKETLEATTLAHPPEMPIVVDEQAVEDILGVCLNYGILLEAIVSCHMYIIKMLACNNSLFFFTGVIHVFTCRS